MPDRYRGLPVIDSSKCPEGCDKCASSLPDRRDQDRRQLKIDLGRCLFCTDCTDACPEGAIAYTPDFRLATRNRDDLVTDGKAFELAAAIDEKSRRIFGRSLQLRQVSAGGLQCLRSGHQRAGHARVRPGPFRHPDRRFAPPRRRADRHGPVTAKHEAGVEKDLRRHARPKVRDRGRGVCDQRRAVRRSRGTTQRLRQHPARRHVHSRAVPRTR